MPQCCEIFVSSVLVRVLHFFRFRPFSPTWHYNDPTTIQWLRFVRVFRQHFEKKSQLVIHASHYATAFSLVPSTTIPICPYPRTLYILRKTLIENHRSLLIRIDYWHRIKGKIERGKKNTNTKRERRICMHENRFDKSVTLKRVITKFYFFLYSHSHSQTHLTWMLCGAVSNRNKK